MARFTSNEQPENRRGRGRSFKNRLLDVIRDEALLDTPPNSTDEKVEELFLKHFAERAFDREDQSSAVLLKELVGKTYPSLKSVLPEVEFEFDPEASPVDQVMALMKAVSEGGMPPDIAALFIRAIRDACEIEEHLDLKQRIEALEQLVES